MGFKVFFWVGAVFPRVFGDFCCSNIAKVIIFLVFLVLCCVALHKTSSEILVFHVGFNAFLGVQSFRESCFMWVLAALMKNPCVSCGF